MLKKILAFISTTEALKSTLRHNWTRTGRQESSAEHSWRAALLLVTLVDHFKIKINLEKTIEMIIIHDIPEIIEGDIPGFIKIKKEKNHHQREMEHAKKIFSLLPKPLNKKYLDTFIEFEENKSLEAKLANTIDRIESQLQHLDSGPKYWGPEETGEHMLNWPNKYIKKLGNKDIEKFWLLIRKEIKKLTP